MRAYLVNLFETEKVKLRIFSLSLIKLSQVALCAGLVSIANADVLTLKDGTVMNGSFLGSDGKTIKFETNIGQLTVEKAKIVSIGFTDQVVSPASAPVPDTAATDAAPRSTKVTLPSGTLMLVRMTSSVNSKSRPGSPFTALLADDLRVERIKSR